MREWEEQILSHIKNILFYLVFLNVNIYIFNTTIVMIDDKKIEEAAQGTADLYEQDLPIMSYNEDTEVDGQHHFCQEFGAELFKDGAKWAINEFLNDLNELLHPASEVPRNDNGKILAFSKVNSNIKLYDMNAMLNETACDTYQEMWEIRVRAYTFTDWVFVEELLDLIVKGGE